MQFYGKAESVATRIVEQFQAGNIPKALAHVFIRRRDSIPCRSWSWTNQLLTALSGYDDARSYLDWQAVGRQVRKGERAFHILEPCMKKIRDTDPDTGEERERMALYGFKAGARFGLEQTDVTDAEKWAKHSGHVHAADDRLGALQERGQHWRSETVAELGGAVLLSCIGQDHDADLGGCWQYIEAYARENGREPANAAMSVLNRLCKAVALILEAADELAGKAVAA